MAQSFVYGTVVLISAGLLNRIIGFAYQIFMIRLIQPEGVGLFNMVYPFYVLLLVMATLGIPLAVAKLVAEEVAQNNLAGAYRIFRTSLAFLSISSVIITIALFFVSPLILKYVFPNPKAYLCFISLSPAIIIVSLCSAFRGFFQGLQLMGPTAISQTLEQIVRVCLGLFLAYLLLPRGIAYATIGVALGVVGGELVGFVSMLYIYRKRRPKFLPAATGPRESLLGITRRIFALGIPVTLTRSISTALMSVEAFLIPQRLIHAGISLTRATSLYGQLAGISETLLYTPSIITISLATALLPAIADALAQQNEAAVKFRVEEALRLTVLTGLPAIVFFLVIPGELCGILFEHAGAGITLKIMALGGIFLYLQQTTTGILQGLGKPMLPFKNLVAASIFKLAGIFFLTAIPWLNMRGTAASLAFYYILMACLNMRDLYNLVEFSLDTTNLLIKPLFCAMGMALAVLQMKNTLLQNAASPGMALAVTLLGGTVAYVFLLLLTRTVNRSDLIRLKLIFRPRA